MMGRMMTITFRIEESIWQRLQERSSGLSNQSLSSFLFQVGDRILEGIERQSKIMEANQEKGTYIEIDFAQLLETYQMRDFIKKAELGELT